ncbi:Sigma_adaptin [Hexamita inflata]|uniref:AP complex subunit sigma n=1 Tax=Hexamita inflata TaxID=28002 RepID=A0AA86PFD0_9EUKA|nr:Sigma adaptin [Hexamita inflata]CAI9958726.1 Sigma adaptin [Hexamita inflata]CAI9963041.1 Sigma adaptin [Hexamita inflata]
MIHFILCQNRFGRTRIAKYYSQYTSEERSVLEKEIVRAVTTRTAKQTNFVEYRNLKLVYRRYAGLFFTICCDVDDNELAMMEAIHLFVETMQQFFGTVCELNLIFDFPKVHIIIDQIILAGQIQETSIASILNNVKQINQFE